VPVIVGAVEQTTNRVIEEARRVIALGADSIVATSLYYAISNAEENGRHFRSIAAAIDVPVFAYDVPVRTHFKLPTDLLVELGRDGVIAGVKDSSGDDVSFRQLLLAAKDIPNFDIFTGHEVVVDGALLGGAQGVVPGLGNVDPAGYKRLYDAAVAGDWAGAAAEQDRLADVFEIVYTPKAGRVSGNAAGLGAFKTALQLMGVIKTNVMSAPMLSLDEDETKAIRVILERNGLV
jgi:4-hydroxy-tetrahydrodipicolinate synthase